MKQRIFLAFVLVLLVFSFACSGGGKGRRGKSSAGGGGPLGPDAEVLVPGYTNPEGHFEIYEYEQLKWIADQVNNSRNEFPNASGSVVKLMNDIDLAGKSFSGIAVGGSVDFKGTFDGGGFEIKNMKIDAPGKDYVGFIGKTSSNAVVGNLRFYDAIIEGENYVGIVGDNSGTIERCRTAASGEFDNSNNLGKKKGRIRGKLYVGSMAGKNSGIIKECYNGPYAEVRGLYSDGDDSVYTGGIVGDNSGTVENVYNIGDVGTTGGTAPGGGMGIVGKNTGTVNKCYAKAIDDSKGKGEQNYVTKPVDFDNKTLLEGKGWDFTNIWESVGGKTGLRYNK